MRLGCVRVRTRTRLNRRSHPCEHDHYATMDGDSEGSVVREDGIGTVLKVGDRVRNTKAAGTKLGTLVSLIVRGKDTDPIIGLSSAPAHDEHDIARGSGVDDRVGGPHGGVACRTTHKPSTRVCCGSKDILVGSIFDPRS